MRKIFIPLIFSTFFLYTTLVASEKAHSFLPIEIALTFDDAPRPDTAFFTGAKRTETLIKALKEKNIKQAGFFCNTNEFSSEEAKRVGAYAESGHIIGNHGAHHFDYEKVGFDLFTSDFEEAEAKLLKYPTYQKIFRFPYLRQGVIETNRNRVTSYLEGKKYCHGYVTIETYDWHLDQLFQKDLLANIPVDLEKLKSVYLKILLDGISFYDNLAVQVLKRSPQHVILLHENDINALFIGELISAIEANGGKIIPLSEAYQDPISQHQFDLIPFSQRRIRAIAKKEKFSGSTVSIWEEEDEITKLYLKTVHQK